ncbi:hypothetical protein HYU13_03905 [Candidatus Woesearchaeota archaeon]|nr:hypothetical protein [Candidatus Woesearchaeota archaeon]
MKQGQFNLEEERRKLVLARFSTLNPESKIMLGSGEGISVKDIINHIERQDEFGKKVVDVQINMLKILAGGA